MLGLTLAVTLLSADSINPIQTAMDYYQGIKAYEVTIKSASGGKTEIMRYHFKKPGHVRMDFVIPFKGAVLIYDPANNNAKLWPFGYHRFPSFTLSPTNSIIQSSTGQRVDRSDVGVLYRNVKTLQENGSTKIAGIESIGERETLHLTVTGDNGFAIGAVTRYQLWLDRSNGFPIKVISYDKNGRVIETVNMTELTVSPEFPAGFFTQ